MSAFRTLWTAIAQLATAALIPCRMWNTQLCGFFIRLLSSLCVKPAPSRNARRNVWGLNFYLHFAQEPLSSSTHWHSKDERDPAYAVSVQERTIADALPGTPPDDVETAQS
jgi:hypothetical protein